MQASSSSQSQPVIGIIGMGDVRCLPSLHLHQAASLTAADGEDVRPAFERGRIQDVSQSSAYITDECLWIGRIYVCDKPDSFERLQQEYQGALSRPARGVSGLISIGTGITPLRDGHAVSRLSDLIIYSVEAGAIGAVVREYGPSTKVGATVAGQTSVKAPEKDAFERYLPQDVDIVSVHSLHGPGVTTEGQPLVS